MIQLNVRVPETLDDDIEAAADKHGVTKTEIVREGIRRQLMALSEGYADE